MVGSSYLAAQLWSLPATLVTVVGIIIALVRWRHHPTVSLVALIAFALMLCSRLLMPLVFGLRALMGQSNAFDPSGAVNLIYPVVIVLGLVSQVLLLLAIFGWRANPAAHHPDE
jgi:hypothetical protein